ncbi:unnamed protein product [Rhizoctonia solani]|uniref:Zn(2)-C6 fungal-type domain-containing protein n=1 Tax=Rhizoctonia solani TaxID=456999 RepID=A0A8H3GQ87_9AGAM|nr:unnamed protein product [Rhizoctonia solani]
MQRLARPPASPSISNGTVRFLSVDLLLYQPPLGAIPQRLYRLWTRTISLAALMASTRSTIGCFACKSRRKKCDETKPRCLRCQKSHIECPGYTYIQDPSGKPRTLPGLRTAHRSQTTIPQANSSAGTGEPGLQPPLDGYLMPACASYGTSGTSIGGNVGKLAPDMQSNQLASSSSSSGSFTHLKTSSHTSHEMTTRTAHPGPGTSKSMTSGQASLLTALFSLGSTSDVNLSPRSAHPSANPNISSVSVETRKQDNVRLHECDVPQESVAVIRPELVLDRTTESNSLTFVLHGYAALVSRMALEPQKLMSSAREFVFRYFEDGNESRCIVGLLANLGSRIATVGVMEGGRNLEPLISALNSTVQWQLDTIKSRPNSTGPELIKALDYALEVQALHIYADSPAGAKNFGRGSAVIFRQLCSEPLNEPIDLSALLQHPVRCLRHYAGASVFLDVLSDFPTLFRFKLPVPGSQYPNNRSSPLPIQEDGFVQWVYGVPNQILLLLATMKMMKQDKFVPNKEMVALLEQDIRNVPPFSGSSSDRFLAVMRSVVQECWRQAAFVYLYMAVCEDSSDTPRVKEAFKRFMRLLDGTRPGRLPDEFLTSPLVIVSPAAQGVRDREVIKQRAVRLHRNGRTFSTNHNLSILGTIEDYWARADAEGRPVLWSDVAVSRRKVMGI